MSFPSRVLLQQWQSTEIMDAFNAAYDHWQQSPLLEGESELALNWMREIAPLAVRRYLPYVEEKLQKVTTFSVRASSPQSEDLIALEFEIAYRPSVRGQIPDVV